MRLLLDTHTFHWAVDTPERLGPQARSMLTDNTNELFLSAISGWELAQHEQRGRIRFEGSITAWMPRARAAVPVEVLPISMEIALSAELLDYPHRDPADRFVLATALLHDLHIVSVDGRMKEWLPELVHW